MFKIHRIIQSSRGSAILIALIILILLTIVTTVFLEKIWHFSQSSNGIEASNAAYYNAIGIAEEQLMDPAVGRKSPWMIANKSDNHTSTGRSLTVSTSGSILPETGKGNSTFDKDYNIIALGEPLQLVIPNGVDWSKVLFEFRVPSINGEGTGVLTTMNASGVILWTIGYSGAALYASGETQVFHGSDVNHPTIQFGAFSGTTNSGSNMTINSFYNDISNTYLGTNGSKCAGYNCTLKLSMLRPIVVINNDSVTTRTLPFLEYKINFDTSNSNTIKIPNQYMTLNTSGYSYGFYRAKTIRIPQITTNTALDFAVLQ